MMVAIRSMMLMFVDDLKRSGIVMASKQVMIVIEAGWL
jgi:hypothetical protein